MELIVLGSGGGWPRVGGAACGYLVRQDGFVLWVDAGTGTMANLQEHVGLLDVGAVAISHRHFDHFLDLYPYFLSRWLHPDQPPKVPLFAPPGMLDHAMQLEEKLAITFESRPVEPGRPFEIGPFRVSTAPMAHPVPTLGMRIEADGQALAYTGDTGPSDELVGLARDADVLLSEATWLDRPAWADAVHLTAAEAGDHAARSEVGSLVLTHIWPALDEERAAEMAAERFHGPVSLAEPGRLLDVAGGRPDSDPDGDR